VCAAGSGAARNWRLDLFHDWVRKEQLANSLGDPVPSKGETSDPNAKRIQNGIIGDARRSTAALGKRLFDMKVDYAVKQIRELLK
jgi:creatinine amidohydrolase